MHVCMYTHITPNKLDIHINVQVCTHAGVFMCLCENNIGKEAINLRGSEEWVWKCWKEETKVEMR